MRTGGSTAAWGCRTATRARGGVDRATTCRRFLPWLPHALSQPRIDYGLTTCPRCRPDHASPIRRRRGSVVTAPKRSGSGRPHVRAARGVVSRRGRPPQDEAAQRERLEAFHQQLTDQVLRWRTGRRGRRGWPPRPSSTTTPSTTPSPYFCNGPRRPRSPGTGPGSRSAGRSARASRASKSWRRSPAASPPRTTTPEPPRPRRRAASRQPPGEPAAEQLPARSPASGPRRLVGVRIAFVFDLSQTDPIPGAPPLPSPPPSAAAADRPGSARAVGWAGPPGRRGGLHPPR